MEKGQELITLIEMTRKELNHENYHITNANWRIKTYNEIDGIWHRIKKEHEVKLHEVTNRLEKLMQEFSSLKTLVSKEEWNCLLENLGNVLAKTEDIEHVANSLYDEYDLHRALAAVEQIIKKKYEDLQIAKEQGDEDIVTLINSQLRYHENDMSLHYWGKERLEKMYDNYNKGKGRK